MANPRGVAVIQETQKSARRVRSPQHTFHLRHQPFQIQPFCIAPVLPGETMKQALIQARIVTDPIRNPLIGWWCEYYLFYVKHRDMYERDTLTEMVLNPEASTAGIVVAGANAQFYKGANSIDWVNMCLKRVVDEYFRNEGEATGQAGEPTKINNIPPAAISQSTWLDSATNGALAVDAADEDLTGAGSEFGAAVKISEIDNAWRRYTMMSMAGLTDQTYEDFLATYGVRPKPEELHKPELIRFIKDWSYPTNTIDPTNGTPRSAVSWSVAERADKDRFFREPGFIFGVTVVRPKVYLKNARAAAVAVMNDVYGWLPAVMSDDPRTSLKNVAATTPPLSVNTDDYWIDVKDLLLYGDQFLNFDHFTTAIDAVAANVVGLPTAALQKRYPVAADVDALFANIAPLNLVRQDGVLSLHIMGRQVDTTPMSVGTGKTV